MSDLLRLSAVEKSFVQGDSHLTIFRDLSLALQAGEIVALVGQSGSGKSTLLQQAGLLDRPTSGEVFIEGSAVSGLADIKRTNMRLKQIGFIYQFHHLLPEFSALENVMMPGIILGIDQKRAKERAGKLLRSLGLGKRISHRPAQLSGGEQQRVAIARALMNKPKLILADEPTGNLDPESSALVFDTLLEQVRQRQIGALIATHNHDLAARMDRVLVLENGILRAA